MSELKVPPAAFALDRDYEGHIFISDIDKTYLATEFESVWGLIRTAFENPERKNNIGGFPILLRAVRRGALQAPAEKPLFFVSASPPQMEDKIRSKMELDGVEHDGIIFKNQLQNVRERKFQKLKEQIGYKLSALLSLWKALPKKSKLVLFGDDSETDATVYSLFSDVIMGRLRGRALQKLLLKMGVFREDALRIAWLSRHFPVPPRPPVEAVFINLVAATPAAHFSKFGPHFYPTENTLQAAFTLYHLGLIRSQGVYSIGRDLLMHHDFTPQKLLETLVAASRRAYFPHSILDELWPELYKLKVLPPPEPHSLGVGERSDYIPQDFASVVHALADQKSESLDSKHEHDWAQWTTLIQKRYLD